MPAAQPAQAYLSLIGERAINAEHDARPASAGPGIVHKRSPTGCRVCTDSTRHRQPLLPALSMISGLCGRLAPAGSALAGGLDRRLRPWPPWLWTALAPSWRALAALPAASALPALLRRGFRRRCGRLGRRLATRRRPAAARPALPRMRPIAAAPRRSSAMPSTDSQAALVLRNMRPAARSGPVGVEPLLQRLRIVVGPHRSRRAPASRRRALAIGSSRMPSSTLSSITASSLRPFSSSMRSSASACGTVRGKPSRMKPLLGVRLLDAVGDDRRPPRRPAPARRAP